MNKNLGFLALTGVLLLASCGSNQASAPAPQPAPTTGTQPQPTQPQPTQPGTAKPAAVEGAYYVRADGTQVAITQADLAAAGSRFVFYAWMEDKQGGINPASVGTATDPGAPTQDERIEVAPIQHQNLMAGYVGYRGDNGQIYPVVGANVRWDIRQDTDGDNRAIQFSAADDGGAPTGARPQDINDQAKSANTYTNSATGMNARFPSSPANPPYNRTGVATPDTNGFTWAALFSPLETTTTAKITAIAYINDTEINKQFLQKTFAPSAALAITKTVTPGTKNVLGLNEAGSFTITVTNNGQGPATNIQLNDVLRSGNADAYSVTAPTGTTANSQDGFNAVIDVLNPGESRTFTLPAMASATGVYCDLASITSYQNGLFGMVNPTTGTLQAEACLQVTAPQLSVMKMLVDASGNPIASGQQVAPNAQVRTRITVMNKGDAAATNVVVTDALTSGAAANYSLTAPQGTTANGDDGFTSAAFDLAPGASKVFDFVAMASADGTYCDTASFTSNNGNPNTATSDNVCFTVVSPNLAITKTNTAVQGGRSINNLAPGSSYNSTITVTNSGTGAATQVSVRDLLGRIADGSVKTNFGSGTYTLSTGTTVNQTGSLTSDGNYASAPVLTIAAGQTLTLNLTSSIPAGARPGDYCDVASYSSTNGGTGETRACVTVVTFVSEQTQLTDQVDPITAGDTNGTVVTSALIVEPSSNEGARDNAVNLIFGTTDPTNRTVPGVFNYDSTALYYDPSPVRDPITGAVTSNYTNGSVRQLTPGTDYTLSATSGTGQQSITFNPNFVIAPGGVVFTRTHIFAPAGTAARQYQETLYWTNNAQYSGAAYQNFKAESTTVISSQ